MTKAERESLGTLGLTISVVRLRAELKFFLMLPCGRYGYFYISSPLPSPNKVLA